MFIVVKSFNYKLLDYFMDKVKKDYPLGNLSILNLPSKRKKWSVLRSPHVNSKSKEQFEMLVYSRGIILKNLTKSDSILLEKSLKSKLVSGISLKIKY